MPNIRVTMYTTLRQVVMQHWRLISHLVFLQTFLLWKKNKMFYLFSFLFLILSAVILYGSSKSSAIKVSALVSFWRDRKLFSSVFSLFSFGVGTYLLTLAEGFLSGIFCSVVLWMLLSCSLLLFVPLIFQKS